MFGLLDYETWIIRRGDQVVGQVTLNTSDRTVHLTPHDVEGCVGLPVASHTRLVEWFNWVRNHEQLP
jgi:hypothetical protein